MRLLPRIKRFVGIGRQLVGRMVQPAMPHRRNARGVFVTPINHPTALAAVTPAAALERAAAALTIISVAEDVGADEFAFEPREESCADGHCRPETYAHLPAKPPETRATMAPCRSPVQAAGLIAKSSAIRAHRVGVDV